MKKLLLAMAALCLMAHSYAQTWTADNGNGTYTNPIFYDEFTDPDMIRVGDEFYFVSSSMHMMPGLPLLRSKDLVNWDFVTYIFDKLELGPDFHLEGKKGVYGNGIWAPAIRYHKGTFYVFVNVNDHGLQVFSANKPEGPWKHTNMGGKIYDLGVLFDDDDRIYAVYGYDEVHIIEMKPDFSGYVEGSDKVIIPKGNVMGEGHHFYKINGKYYIISADYSPVGRMQCARADKVEGPYETVVISSRETMGVQQGCTTKGVGFWSDIPNEGDKFEFNTPNDNYLAAVPLHQGGIVDTPDGEWWGFSMMDMKSVGRLTYLSPVTWKDGWPYFGICGNLGRSPRTFTKPHVGVQVKPHAPYDRNDDFAGKQLKPVWQWNHIPVDGKWKLANGALRLYTLPAKSFMFAKNTLTQRVAGPVSTATAELDAHNLKKGDVAGLALLNTPYYWIGVLRTDKGLTVRCYDLVKNTRTDEPVKATRLWFRACGDYDKDKASLSYSVDGKEFKTLGSELRLGYQMHTFQGVRYALFAYNTEGKQGGYAAFDDFKVCEPMADRSKNLPLGKVITLTNLADGTQVWANPHGMLHRSWQGSKTYNGDECKFRVIDRGNGLVSLKPLNGDNLVSVAGEGLSGDVRLVKQDSDATLFMWQDMLFGHCMLMSMKTHRYLGAGPTTGEPYSADSPGAQPDRKDGAVFSWTVVE